jgi:hypothetical protein
MEEGGGEDGEGSEESGADGQAVESVDEVEGVGATEEPEDGEGQSPPVGELESAEAVDLDAAPVGQGGGGELAEELLPGLEAEEVVEEAGGEDDDRGWGEFPDQREGLLDDVPAFEGGEHEEAERREVGEGDGEAADAWDGAGVKLAALVRAVEATQAEAEVADEGREEEGEGEGGEGEEEEGVHGGSL